MCRVTGIGLHSIPGRALQFRGGRDHALDPGITEVAGEVVSGRAGLVDNRGRAGQRARPLDDLERVVGELLPDRLLGINIDRVRDHRSCVHVQADERTIREHWGLQSRLVIGQPLVAPRLQLLERGLVTTDHASRGPSPVKG